MTWLFLDDLAFQWSSRTVPNSNDFDLRCANPVIDNVRKSYERGTADTASLGDLLRAIRLFRYHSYDLPDPLFYLRGSARASSN
jgi:hypothetical protein